MTLKAPVLMPDHIGSEYNYKKHLLLLELPCERCRLVSNEKRCARRNRNWTPRRSDNNNFHCWRCGGYVRHKAFQATCKNCGALPEGTSR